jgi:hypothetical protein
MPRPALKPVLALASLLAFGPALSACGVGGGNASGRADVAGARQRIARYRGEAGKDRASGCEILASVPVAA